MVVGKINSRMEPLRVFLFLREKIADQWDLAVAINDAELFIIENNLK
jgi:hypothetical protein